MKAKLNLTVDREISAEAREMGLNMSALAEEAIRLAVKKERGRRWAEENKEALEDYARKIETEGLTLEKYRMF